MRKPTYSKQVDQQHINQKTYLISTTGVLLTVSI